MLPDVFPNPGDVPLLDSTSGTFSFGSGTGLITGKYFEAVVLDPLGATCAGCLDFAYQVSLDSGLSAGIFGLNSSRFFGFTTDVGYLAGSGVMGGSGGDGTPIAVSRGPFGGGIGFTFVRPGVGAPIGPGGSSAILVVVTNARAYDRSGAMGISGGRADSLASGQITDLFEPSGPPVPEPSTLLLLSAGLVGMVVFRRRAG